MRCIRSKSSRSSSASGASSMMPAVLTTTSTPPNSASTCVEQRGDLGFVGDVGAHHDGPAARGDDLVGDRLGAVAVARVVHGDGHARLGEPDGHGAADAARAPVTMAIRSVIWIPLLVYVVSI